MEVIQFSQLVDTDGRGYICHIVLVARSYNAIEPSCLRCVTIEGVAVNTMQTHDPTAGCHLCMACYDHPSFAGSKRLCRVKAKNRRIATERTDEVTARGSWQGVSRILHNLEPVRRCGDKNRLHIAGDASEVNRHDGLRTFGNGDPYSLRINVEGVFPDIGKDWMGAEITDYLPGRGERVRRGNNFVAP